MAVKRTNLKRPDQKALSDQVRVLTQQVFKDHDEALQKIAKN